MAIPSLSEIAAMTEDEIRGWWFLNMLIPRARDLGPGEMHAVLSRARQLGVELHKQGKR